MVDLHKDLRLDMVVGGVDQNYQVVVLDLRMVQGEMERNQPGKLHLVELGEDWSQVLPR
jgi:hypothetical protein